ncbi:MAG: electron transfer flavoprotein subunit alpha/FixB family protein [Gordonibacter sp.]|uniref:electron transfer flavoprotein subunit alpha/FixB family protein n=1 Tax=Gordonibacter sp. TaxID=1968902 RepID=UPI002FC69FD6
MKALVIADNVDTQRELCAGARTLADTVLLAVIGTDPVPDIADVAYALELPVGQAFENAYDTVEALFDELSPEIVFVQSSPRMKIVGGRLAAHADTSLITDVTAVYGDEAESMYFGGLAVKRQKASGPVRFYSSSGAAFCAEEATGTDRVETRAFATPSHPLTVRATKPVSSEGGELGRASVVVGAGRGFAHKEDLQMARDLAHAVRGETACSRPLAENEKWMAKSLYLGVSGRMISPKVYFALGISGQMQHMVGVHNADIIVAVNKDQNAPVFNQADYGIVGDLHEVLPALTAKLA